MDSKLNLTERLLAEGIRLPPGKYSPGDHKVLCPKCSHTRKHKSDPCLSVTIMPDSESAVWMCHNCDWSGGTKPGGGGRGGGPRPRRARPQGNEIERPSLEVMRWFADRGISAEVVERNKIGFKRQHWFAQLNDRVPAICFRYFRQGELINVKYRALAQKAFAQEKDAESHQSQSVTPIRCGE
jgi:twinkle protein